MKFPQEKFGMVSLTVFILQSLMVAMETSMGTKESVVIEKSQHFLKIFHVLGMILGVLQVIAFFDLCSPTDEKTEIS